MKKLGILAVALIAQGCSVTPETNQSNEPLRTEILGDVTKKDVARVYSVVEQYPEREALPGVETFVKKAELAKREFLFQEEKKDMVHEWVFWLDKAARAGDINSQITLAGLYERGVYIPKNPKIAEDWKDVAASKGLAPFAYTDILLNAKESKSVEAVDAEGRRVEELFVSQRSVAKMYANGDGVTQNINKAIELYEFVAKKGDVVSQREVGKLYLQVYPPSPSRAIYWLKEAAKNNDVDAMVTLGDMYLSGFGADKHLTKAFAYYETALRHGSSEAKNNLGLMYFKGLGVERNPELAVEFFKAGMKEGDKLSTHSLAVAYLHGEGTRKDAVSSYALFKLAEKKGVKESTRGVQESENQLTPTGKELANKLFHSLDASEDPYTVLANHLEIVSK